LAAGVWAAEKAIHDQQEGPMAALADRLVGRADELHSFELILEKLSRGHPGAIELMGEAGIGKTRLLRLVLAPRRSGTWSCRGDGERATCRSRCSSTRSVSA
jgi:ABC-type transport system involved in cytochrome c biogenesis ATPase subunit